MSRIIGLMPLLGIDFDLEAVKTVKTRVQVGPLEWGKLRSGTLTVLRHKGDRRTYREIVDALLARNRKAKALDVTMLSKAFDSNFSIKPAVDLDSFSSCLPVACGSPPRYCPIADSEAA